MTLSKQNRAFLGLTVAWCPILLPTSEGIISALEKIVKAFEDTIQVQLIKERWEEIKTLQVPALSTI